MEDEQVEVRVGDRERRALDERLQQALADGRLTLSEYEERATSCWAARTRGDLNQLTRDLPDAEPEQEAPQPQQEPSSAGNDTPAVPATTERKSLSSILGSVAVGAVALFLGSQVLLSADGAAVFSSRTVQAAPDQGQVQVGVLFGSVEVVVPEGVTARSTGFTMFGSVDCRDACAAGDEPQITVDGRGAFGSVEIVTPQEQRAGGLDNDDD